MPNSLVSSARPASASPRILYVEDNPDDRLLLARSLARALPAVVVESVASRAEFDRALAAGEFNLVVTDYALGWGDGLGVLQEVKQRFPDCPVLMCTCSGNEEVAVAAMKGGLHDYILKNRDHLPRLAAAIRGALTQEDLDRQLRATRSRLAWLIDTLDVGIFTATPEGRLMAANGGFRRLLGLPEDSAGWPALSVLEPTAGAWSQLLAPLAEGQANASAEWQMLRATGAPVWHLWRVAVSAGAQGETLVEGIVEDISARKQRELSWRDKHHFISAVLNATSFLVLVLVSDADGRVVFANQKAAQLGGLPPSTLAGRQLHQLLVEPGQQAAMAEAWALLQAEELACLETPMPNASGTGQRLIGWTLQYLPDDHGGRQVIACGMDLTDVRQQQARLVEQGAILELVRDAIVVCDEHSIVRYWNAEAEQLYGVSAAQAVGRPWTESVLWEQANLAGLDELQATLHQAGEWRGEMMQQRLDGRHLHVAVSIGRRHLPGGGIFVAVIRDMTQRREMEEALRKSETTQRMILSQVPAILWAVDRELRYTISVGSGLESLAQVDGQALGRQLPEVVKGDPQADFIIGYHRRALNGEGGKYEFAYRGGDYSVNVQPLRDAAGAVVGVIGVALDITPLKNSQAQVRQLNEQLEAKVEARTRELRQSESTLRLFVEHSPAAICMLDRQQRCVLVSQRWLQDFALTREQVIGVPLATAMARLPEGWRQLLNQPRRQTRSAEEPYQHADGRQDWLSWDSVPWRDERGRRRGLMIVSEFITSRKESEQRLLKHQAELQAMASALTLAEEAERRRLAGILHDVLGHDLLNSHMKLESCMALVRDPAILACLGEARKLLETSIRDSRTLTFELSVPTLYELGLHAALDWLAGHMQKQYQLPVQYRQTGQLWDIAMDQRVLLFRAVRELLTNIVKHAHASQAWVVADYGDKYLRVTVSDNGVGIQNRDQALHPSVTQGFGLFRIRERLEQMGGRLTLATPASGSGTTVILEIPGTATKVIAHDA